MSGNELAIIELPEGDIYKSNQLIESKYDLSLVEQRLVLLAISKLNSGSWNKNIVSISVKEYCNLFGGTQDRYGEIRTILRNLRKKEIIITRYDNNDEIKEELIAGWITSSYYKNGIMEIEFPIQLMSYLVELKERYTLYNIKNISTLTSKHSIRLYEIMKEYEYRGVVVIRYERLKELICGIDKFERYYDFKKRILLISQDEIRQKTDIYFEYKEIRNGKKIENIEFKICKNKAFIENNKKNDLISNRTSYYGDSDVVTVVNEYKSKSQNSLIDELNSLFNKYYYISFTKEELSSYSKKTLMNIIFGIVDGVYVDVKKPKPYFKKVLNKENEL